MKSKLENDIIGEISLSKELVVMSHYNEMLLELDKEENELLERRKSIKNRVLIYYEKEEEFEKIQKEREEEERGVYHSEEEREFIELEIINQKIQSIQQEKLKIISIKELSEFKNRYKKGVAISDNKTSNDKLNRKGIAKVLANFIADTTSEKINIGIFGEWGQGKSSFIEMIKEYLEKIKNNEKENRLHIIKFNASEYDDREKIWSQLLNILFNEFKKENKIRNQIKYNCELIKKELFNNWGRYILYILILIVGMFYISIMIDINKIRNLELTSLLSLIPIVIVFLPTLKNIVMLSNKISSSVVNRIKLPEFSSKLGFKKIIKDKYETLSSTWLKENEKIIVFIDDLDRLSQKNIVEFFEALQLFIDNNELIFIMGIELKTVSCAIAESKKFQRVNKFNTVQEKVNLGMNYIEKYINFPVYLNNKKVMDEYINSITKYETETNLVQLVQKTKIKEEKSIDEQFTISNEENKKIIEVIKALKIYNPRDVKKILNILLLSKNINIENNLIKIENRKEDIIIFQDYISWFIFSYKNNKISRGIIRKIEKYKIDDFLINIIKDELKEFQGNKDLKVVELLNTKDIQKLDEIARIFIFDSEEI